MNKAVRTNVFVSFAAVGFAVLLLPQSVAAQGRSPQSLQPDLFISIAMDRHTPVAHGNLLPLPSPNGRKTFTSGNRVSTLTAPDVTNALSVGTALYTVGPM